MKFSENIKNVLSTKNSLRLFTDVIYHNALSYYVTLHCYLQFLCNAYKSFASSFDSFRFNRPRGPRRNDAKTRFRTNNPLKNLENTAQHFSSRAVTQIQIEMVPLRCCKTRRTAPLVRFGLAVWPRHAKAGKFIKTI